MATKKKPAKKSPKNKPEKDAVMPSEDQASEMIPEPEAQKAVEEETPVMDSAEQAESVSEAVEESPSSSEPATQEEPDEQQPEAPTQEPEEPKAEDEAPEEPAEVEEAAPEEPAEVEEAEPEESAKVEEAEPEESAKVEEAETADPAPSPKDEAVPMPAVGDVLTRSYKGRVIRAEVVSGGFQCEGKTYTSLSALAKQVTGYKAINGRKWFGIGKAPASTRPRGNRLEGKVKRIDNLIGKLREALTDAEAAIKRGRQELAEAEAKRDELARQAAQAGSENE